MKYLFSLFVLTVGLYSCGSGNQTNPVAANEKSVFMHALKDTFGIVRGVELGEEYAVVEQMEYDSALVIRSRFNLVYNYAIDADNMVDVKYVFAETALRFIEMNISLESEGLADSVATDFQNYFNSKFGNPDLQMGVYVWIAPNAESNGESRIELVDESAEFGYGKLNIRVYAVPRADQAA